MSKKEIIKNLYIEYRNYLRNKYKDESGSYILLNDFIMDSCELVSNLIKLAQIEEFDIDTIDHDFSEEVLFYYILNALDEKENEEDKG